MDNKVAKWHDDSIGDVTGKQLRCLRMEEIPMSAYSAAIRRMMNTSLSSLEGAYDVYSDDDTEDGNSDLFGMGLYHNKLVGLSKLPLT